MRCVGLGLFDLVVLGDCVWFGCAWCFRCVVVGFVLCLPCYCLGGDWCVGARGSAVGVCDFHGVWVCLDLLLVSVVNSVVFILLLCSAACLFVVVYCGFCWLVRFVWFLD